MKKTAGIPLFLLISFFSFAQGKYSPVIKQGTKLRYFVLTPDGQSLPFIASFDSLAADYIRLGWNIEGMGTGSWIMKKKSLESAMTGRWAEPVPNTNEELPDDQVILLFSKVQW